MSNPVCLWCGHDPYVVPKRRSTGPFSQNHAEWGFADQIARGLEDGTTKREVLVEAMVRAGLEPQLNHFGRRVFRESNLSKKEASRVIDELREIAQFCNIRLNEAGGELPVRGGEDG